MRRVNIEQRIEELEGLSVDVLTEYLTNSDPQKPLIERAKVAVGTFGAIQRRRSAENQRDALMLMMQRESRPPRQITSGPFDTAPTSSKNARAD